MTTQAQIEEELRRRQNSHYSVDIVPGDPVSKTKDRKITISRKSVTEDIDRRTLKLRKVALAGQPVDAADHLASDSTERFDGALVSRYVEKRDAKLRKRLAFCLKEEEILEVVEDTISSDRIVYDLRLGLDFKDSQLKPILTLIHEYLVTGAIADWYGTAGTNYGMQCAVEAINLENQIVSALRVSGFAHCAPQPWGPVDRNYEIDTNDR